MTTETTTAKSYDEVLYPSEPLPQSHPDRLATIARLFGAPCERIDRCRVLELGCGTGGNLIPMADRHPESSFLGIDISGRQIEAGHRAIAALGLTNIELAQRSILDLGDELGQFDYLICHGVFSWVTPEVQEKTLSLCHACLAPQGIAYLSYNVYPAWHLRGAIREIALQCMAAEPSPGARVARLRRSLAFLSAALAEEPTAYSQFFKDDIDFVLAQPDNYLAHEHLEEELHPLYFHEFARRAAAHRLQYLGDSVLSMMFPSNLGAKAEQDLTRFSTDLIAVEQYMDVLWNRSFRNTLLCHENVPLRRQLTPANLGGLHFAGPFRPESPAPDLASNTPEKFVTPKGVAITTAVPSVKAALSRLGTRWPQAVSFEELASADGPLSQDGRQAVGDALLQCLVPGIVEARSAPDSFVATVSVQPRASQLARTQACSTPRVTNRRHEVVTLDEVSQNTLAHLDGRHDRAALSQVLREAMARGRLSIFRNGVPLGRGEVADALLETALDGSLASLAEHALLVA